jgi:hypothetical protein
MSMSNMSLPSTTVQDHGRQFRAKLATPLGMFYSQPATLTVWYPPIWISLPPDLTISCLQLSMLSDVSLTGSPEFDTTCLPANLSFVDSYLSLTSVCCAPLVPIGWPVY